MICGPLFLRATEGCDELDDKSILGETEYGTGVAQKRMPGDAPKMESNRAFTLGTFGAILLNLRLEDPVEKHTKARWARAWLW